MKIKKNKDFIYITDMPKANRTSAEPLLLVMPIHAICLELKEVHKKEYTISSIYDRSIDTVISEEQYKEILKILGL